MFKEKYQPTEEELKLAESHAEDYAEAEKKEMQQTVDLYNGILNRAKNGELTPQDEKEIDGLLESLSNAPLHALLADEEKISKANQSDIGKILLELFSDSKSFVTIKKFALQAYEDNAMQDSNSPSFQKLRMFGGIAKNLADDSGIADRFTAEFEDTTPEPETDEEKRKGIKRLATFRPPKWSYKK